MLGVCRYGCVASASVVSASCSSCQILRSCTVIVRIIPLTQKPGKLSPSHHALEGGMPWCCIIFSLSWLYLSSYDSSSCYTSPGPDQARPHPPRQPRPSSPSASVLPSPKHARG